MPDIKLFVCCHREDSVPKQRLLFPIQVGAALADTHFEGFLHDDTGVNISAKNRSYCELTAQYWAWKNIDADYYGFFHYRRYLFPKKEKLPYIIRSRATVKQLHNLGYDGFEKVIECCDMIAPTAENMHISVLEQYASAPHHYGKDIELARSIIIEQWSEMTEAANAYLSGTESYFGNIFIMKREVFFDYCAWLFSVLEEYDSRADNTGYDAQARRVDGYLAERLFGIYYTYRRRELKTAELPKVHFEADTAKRMEMRLRNALLPPGSALRATVKQILKNI